MNTVMFFYEGQKCPVCGNFFGEQDDIVTCPECGAPHHRNCWKTEGHCHFADLHGTGKAWHEEQQAQVGAQAAPKKRCSRCGYDNPEFSEFCARCGKELDAPDWQTQNAVPPSPERPPVGQYTPPHAGAYTSFGQQPFGDPYGGVPRTDTIDGVPVDTMVKLIGPNSAYYLPRFYRMTHGGSKVSWNWSAFFFSYNWLLYRKNILWGVIAFIVSTVVGFFSQAVTDQLEGMLGGSTMEAMMQAAQRILASEQGQLLWSILSLLSLVALAVKVLIGLFGNYLYLRAILNKAKKREGEILTPYDEGFRKSGGVSFALAMAPELLVLALSYLAFFVLSIL